MVKYEKTEDIVKNFNILIFSLLSQKVKFKEWMFIYNLFLELIQSEKIDLTIIKTYALILINSSVICYYIDDEYELKNNKKKLKEFISFFDKKDVTSNKYNNIEEIYKEIFVLDQNIQLKKRNI